MEIDPSVWATLTGSSFSFWGLMAAAAKLLVYLTSFLATGLALVLVALPVHDDSLLRSLLGTGGASIALCVVASVLRVMVQAGRLMDDVAFMIDPEIVAISLEGPLGTSTLVRLAGLAVLILAIAIPSVRKGASLLGAFLVAASFALTGHATGDPQWALFTLITVHLLAVSFWFGALLPLYRLTGHDSDHDHAARLSRRFGHQASIVVPILILVGGGFAFLLLGSPQAVFGTAYGQMLLVKLSLVGVVLAIAALNKLRFVPALEARQAGADRHFRTSLRWEMLVFLLIFAATAFLTTSFTVPAS